MSSHQSVVGTDSTIKIPERIDNPNRRARSIWRDEVTPGDASAGRRVSDILIEEADLANPGDWRDLVAARVRPRRSRALSSLVLLLLLLLAATVAGCGATAGSPVESATPYLEDAAFRRATFEASLVNRDNGYARLRLAHYASGDDADWDRLPEWNPDCEPIAATELDEPSGASALKLSAAAGPLPLPLHKIDSVDDPALLNLGRAAFGRYPAQLAGYLAVALTSREAAEGYGLWVDPARGVGGLVRARMADGSGALAMTCASCHAAAGGDGIEDGFSNASLDLGAAILAAATTPMDEALTSALARWGKGRVDVTTTTGDEPARIPDLRPIRFQTYLHQDATLAAKDRATLAIRIETLLVTSHGQSLRPPRVVTLALATYLASLATTLPPAENAARTSARGAALFSERCASCHRPPGFTGEPVALAAIGTDPTLGLSPERGTGAYRVPSLRGLGRRTPLLHDASVASLPTLFDPARLSDSFTGGRLGPGAVPGHEFGLDLTSDDRAALLLFLGAL